MPQFLPQLFPYGILAQATTDHAEHEAHKLGDIPSAKLLFGNSVMIAVIMIVFSLLAKRNFQRVPHGSQNFAEYIVEQIKGFVVGIVGPGGEKYVPLVGTLFIYIILANLVGQIPGFHSPTANLTLTFALGVIVFVFVQWEGIRNNGPGGHAMHFMGPKLGKYPLLAPLMLPIELISEIVKPFTLGVRLFGNIFGGDVIIAVIAGLALSLIGPAFGWLPLQLPILFLELLTAFVQALVFCMLTCVYLSLVQRHGDHEEGDGESAGDHSSPVIATGH